jgi:hypothetical protein
MAKKNSELGRHPQLIMQITLHTSGFFRVKFPQNVKIKKKKEVFYCNIPILTEKSPKFEKLNSPDLNSNFSLVTVFKLVLKKYCLDIFLIV